MKSDKDLYRQLRAMSADQLWNEEVPRFNQADARERQARVSVVRAVGVAFAATGSAARKAEVRKWLTELLQDPSEKIRRYAMTAIPKIRGPSDAEGHMISLLKKTGSEREKKHLGRALGKIGGAGALSSVAGLLPTAEQKVKASVARAQQPSSIRMDAVVRDFRNLRIHLRCRKGLESFVREELDELNGRRRKFSVIEARDRYIAIAPTAPFSLSELYTLRCFATVGFSLGLSRSLDPQEQIEVIARMITSPAALGLFENLTEGSLRYRLEFMGKGHQRSAVQQIANRAYQLNARILNDARISPWSVDVFATAKGVFAELRPRIYPDPRWWYRQDDVPAASHPPLAACMARLAGFQEREVVWDPFCGSGLELIERALRGGVARLIGTDVSPEAVRVCEANIAAARLKQIDATVTRSDFRDFQKLDVLANRTVSLVVTNPPMGRRVRIPDMQGLFGDVFKCAAAVLRPGGRLVLVNPLRLQPSESLFKLQFRQVVDLGGFNCHLERYVRT